MVTEQLYMGTAIVSYLLNNRRLAMQIRREIFLEDQFSAVHQYFY